ncbi:TNT domain-containing protein [Kribbella sp. VKM Ac-2568]|uniref:TNT domain-containing protein n=1 Tax=Kribbella sp. VKM Ac-2568 TaxID=2512219 RepID=UPI00351A5A08
MKPGTQVDRFGWDTGRFVAPNGTSIGARSLAPGTTDKPYKVFEVTNRLVVHAGLAQPWFGQPGMGTQYCLPASVGDLLDAGYLRTVG